MAADKRCCYAVSLFSMVSSKAENCKRDTTYTLKCWYSYYQSYFETYWPGNEKFTYSLFWLNGVFGVNMYTICKRTYYIKSLKLFFLQNFWILIKKMIFFL